MSIRIVTDSICDLPEREIPIAQITPVLGAHLGIGALGFTYITKEKLL